MRSAFTLILGAAALLAAASCASDASGNGQNAANSLAARMDDQVESKRAGLIEFRRDLHRHPELSGEEARTAAIIADRLQVLGFTVRRNIGGHGVIAVLDGGKPGKLVAFRADLDAVRSDAPDPVEFKSLRPGVRHICGHDIHMAVAMALAEGFSAIKSDLPGGVMLVFQPSEENATGARAMLAEGALSAPAPDAIYAYHTAPLETGTFRTSPGVLLAGRDRVFVTIAGPQSERIAKELQASLRSIRTVSSAFESQPVNSDFVYAEAVIRPGEGETGKRVIADLTLTTGEARRQARAKLDAAVETSRRLNPAASIEIDYRPEWTPGVRNDSDLALRAAMVVKEFYGEGAISLTTHVTPTFSEDFGLMQKQLPGAMLFLGVSNEEKGWVGLPHTPDYVADEESIFAGSKTMARIMLDYLGVPAE